MDGNRLSIIGQRYGRLIVIDQWVEKSKSACLCKCDCGNTRCVRANDLRSGRTQSCRCLNSENNQKLKQAKTHGFSGANITPEYRCWKALLRRCYSPNLKCYPDYGGRGIRVCARWRKSFMNFLSDMGPRPSIKHSLDRINNDKGYYPNNCRWATWVEQANNRRPRGLGNIGAPTAIKIVKQIQNWE